MLQPAGNVCSRHAFSVPQPDAGAFKRRQQTDGMSDFRCMSFNKVLEVVIGFTESNSLLMEHHNPRPSAQFILGKVPRYRRQPWPQLLIRFRKPGPVLHKPHERLIDNIPYQIGLIQERENASVNTIIVAGVQNFKSIRVVLR